MPTNLSNSKGRNLSLVATFGHEGVIAYKVTLNTYNTYSFFEFIQTKVIPSLHRQRFILMDNVPFHKSQEIQHGFEDVGHIYFHLTSCNPFLNVANG